MTQEQKLLVVILAAGKGSRMKTDLPKVAHTISGLSMFEHCLNTAKAMHPSKIIVVVSSNLPFKDDGFSTVIQNHQLGTGHAVQVALENETGNYDKILVLYADTPLIKGITLKALLATTKENQISVIGFKPKDPKNYGRLFIEGKNLIKIVETKDLEENAEANICNSGIIAGSYACFKKLLPKLTNKNKSYEYYLTDLPYLNIQDSGKNGYLIADENEVLGVNTLTELAIAEKLHQTQLREALEKEGVRFILGETSFVNYDAKIANNVIIYQNNYIGPKVIIHKNNLIKPFCHLESCTIGENSSIGPFARIRPDTILKGDNKVGNFVEIKKSDIDVGTKINHLSYIGDATIGKNTNIGAGTITCNYDGKKKCKTIIGNESFVGSNTALVAPITIGNNVVIGAGSVITKDVADHQLAVARSKQSNIDDYTN